MKRVWIAFAVGCALQWLAPLTQVMRYERVIKNGTVVRMECDAPDPYDLLRGRYLAVRVRPEEILGVRLDLAFERGDTAYALLELDEAGVVKSVQLERDQPQGAVFAKVTVLSVYEGPANDEQVSVRVGWPFDRLYLNENLAPTADQWYRDNIRAEKPILADLRVLDGRVVLVDLLQDGKSFRQLLKELPAP